MSKSIKKSTFELTDGRTITVPYPMTSEELAEKVDLQSGCLWSELETEYEPTLEELEEAGMLDTASK